jgi:hypothetical protein
MLDVVSAEQFVEWRETSFLRNPRLLVSQDATACRALLSAEHATLELWQWGDVEAPLQPPRAYAYGDAAATTGSAHSGSGRLSARERAWVVLASAPEALDADLLLVQFDRDYELPEAACFRSQGAPCAHLLLPPPTPAAVIKKMKKGQQGLHLQLAGAGKGVEAADAHAEAAAPDPAWLLVLGASMRWCGLDRVKIPAMAGLKALDDCFAASERAMAKNYGTVTHEWTDAASGRCAVAAVQRAVEGGSGSSHGGSGSGSGGRSGGGRSGSATQEPMPYALAVAHLLRHRGGTKKVTAMLDQLKPKALRDFASAHASRMRAGKKDSGC